MTENLWGEIPDKPAIKPPAIILKEQASIFSDATEKILTAEVKTRPSSMIKLEGNYIQGFENDLVIVAPALGNYRYTVLTVRHGVAPYPLSIETEVTPRVLCKDENSYLSALHRVLSSARVREAIALLMAQSQATV